MITIQEGTVDPKEYTGYKYQATTPEVEEGEEVASGTVITLTYVRDEEKQKTLSYTVEYYKDNVIDSTKTQTVTENVWVNSTQTTLTVNKGEINTTNAFGEGYVFEETNPVTIPDTIPNGGTIKVYYVSMAEPSLQLTKTALKDGEIAQNIVYIPGATNTFTYRLEVKNTVENSYPAIVETPQTVTDTLPEGITVLDRENLPDGVEVDEVNGREVITWTVSNIGCGADAKYVDINVKIDETVFENQRVDAGEETTVLDVQFSQANKGDEDHYIADESGKVMNLFLRTAGATNKNDGYIYAGAVEVGKRVTQSTFASSEYNDNDKVNNALENEYELEKMLDDFVAANQDGTMAQYVKGGLPTKADINATLNELYNNKVTISDTQVILWYKVVSEKDNELERYYRITDDGTEIFGNYVELPACTYHLDGIIVDISDLGTMIPAGAQVDVHNTAQLVGISGANGTSTATVSIHYEKMDTSNRGSLAINLLSATLDSIENEEITSENIDQITEKTEKMDKDNKETTKGNAVDKPTNSTNVKEPTTTTETDKKEEETTSTNTNGNTSGATTVQPQEPASEEVDNGEKVTTSDDVNKDVSTPTTQSTGTQEVTTE